MSLTAPVRALLAAVVTSVGVARPRLAAVWLPLAISLPPMEGLPVRSAYAPENVESPAFLILVTSSSVRLLSESTL